MYALFNTLTQAIEGGPWTRLPSSLSIPGTLITVSPVLVGYVYEDYRVVNYVVVANPPSPYHVKTGENLTYDNLDTITATYLYERAGGDGPTSADVKAEMERRIHALYDTGDQFKGLRGALKLVYKIANGGTLTAAEQTRMTNIQNAFDQIDAIDQAADDIIALDPIPDDYAADIRWP